MTTVGQKMTELADVVRSKSGVNVPLGLDDIISIVNSINVGGSDIHLQFGYMDNDGNFQRIDTDANGNISEVGPAEAVDSLYVFDTNRPDPEY